MDILIKTITLFFGLLLSNLLFGQSTPSKAPIKYRLLLTSVELQDVNSDEIVITLNAFNTGRNPIDMSQFNSVPDEMEVKFEESFYRSNLSDMEDEIVASLINRNITIANGKILRNLKFNLPVNESLYKELTKSKKKFARNSSSKNKTPKLKYKTNSKKSSGGSDLFAKKKKKKDTKSKTENKVVDTKDTKIAATSKKVDTPEKSKNAAEMVEKELSKTKETNTKIETPVNAKVETDKPEPIKKEKKIAIVSKQKEKKMEAEQVKEDAYKIEQESQKEEKKAILKSLGANKKSSKDDEEVAFDTREGVQESKNSYAEKSVCPDIIFNGVKIIKKTKNYITLEYSLENVGKGPAYIESKSKSTPIAIRAFLSSSENLTRGSLPLGGGFVSYDEGDKERLDVNSNFSGVLKLEIKDMTRFTPYIILNFDPFNVLEECSKSNNYGNIKVGN